MLVFVLALLVRLLLNLASMRIAFRVKSCRRIQKGSLQHTTRIHNPPVPCVRSLMPPNKTKTQLYPST